MSKIKTCTALTCVQSFAELGSSGDYQSGKFYYLTDRHSNKTRTFRQTQKHKKVV